MSFEILGGPFRQAKRAIPFKITIQPVNYNVFTTEIGTSPLAVLNRFVFEIDIMWPCSCHFVEDILIVLVVTNILDNHITHSCYIF